jgi:Tol biopolymer transport system component/predicted Ser/Thr protein kinase
MSLASGTRLGPYDVLGPLGVGGMGEVYRARDSRLKREVALKVLPEAFANDPERMARFQREAEALAALNHPNIAQIYGVEERALVMELVEGETLKGPLPLETALKYAHQIAAALEAAHAKGIVHRDLKPANVKVTSEGVVKVLDFGLAQLSPNRGGAEPDPSKSPTFTMSPTRAGMILGTAAYMSPEQARGKPVDKRTDIWAFGVVLYEMLTGKQAFKGETVSDILAAVLRHEPDWEQVPRKVRRLLKTCLEKDPKQRLQAIGDYRLLLEDTSPVTTTCSMLPWIVAVAALSLIGAVGWLRPWSTTTPAQTVEFSIHAGGVVRGPVISPDGASILYAVNGKHYLRQLDSLQPREVRAVGTFNWPAWSPDSRSIAVMTNGELQTMRLPESAPVSIGPGMISRGRTWGDKGTILVAGVVDEGSGGLYAAQAVGGGLRRVDVSGLKRGRYYFPQFLPGEKDLLFAFTPKSGDTEIYLARFDGRNVANPILLFKNDTAAQYTPAGGGRILFVRGDNLYGQRLDLKARTLVGDAELVAESVASTPFFHEASFSVSRNGEIAWRSGKAELSELAVFSRQGKQIGTVGTPSPIYDIRLSPDETHLLGGSDNEAWLFESDQRGRLSLGREPAWLTWSPDGSRILGTDGQRVVERSVNGAGQVHEIAHGDNPLIFTLDISSDGKALLLSGNSSITSVRLEGSAKEREPKLLVETDELIRYAKFSPDTRWILYKAQPRNGGGGIYVQRFPDPGLRRQIASSTFALSPVWRADGKEILYYDDNHIWSVRVDGPGEDLSFSPPEMLFSVRVPLYVIPGSSVLAVSRDGSRIYCLQSVEQTDADVINVRTALWK